MNDYKKALLIFDGGNAPGYTSVATSLTEAGINSGHDIYSAFEGFRSLTGDGISDERLIRLVMNRRESWSLNAQGIPTRALYRNIDVPGSEFRSERYSDFKKIDKQKEAEQYIKELGFTHIIGIGGNGTLMGIKALAKLLPDVQAGFVNVSVDSDILGDTSVGYMTGVEEGAKIARGLFEDAYTHKRTYILEMMGRESGKHALMAGGSARAHLIVLPSFKFEKNVLTAIADRLNRADHALIVVAEGYEREARAKFLPERVDAAMYFKRQLCKNGLNENDERRVISEPFSRYLRGVRPLYLECSIAYLKSFALFREFDEGRTNIMPYYLGEHDNGVKGFDQLMTNNMVAPSFLDLIDRFRIPALREYISCGLKENCGETISQQEGKNHFD